MDFQMAYSLPGDPFPYVPCEIGIIEYKIGVGEVRFYHHLIAPGPIPQQAKQNFHHTRDNIHGLSDRYFQEKQMPGVVPTYRKDLIDYETILKEIQEFLDEGDAQFVLTRTRVQVDHCLNWLFDKIGEKVSIKVGDLLDMMNVIGREFMGRREKTEKPKVFIEGGDVTLDAPRTFRDVKDYVVNHQSTKYEECKIHLQLTEGLRCALADVRWNAGLLRSLADDLGFIEPIAKPQEKPLVQTIDLNDEAWAKGGGGEVVTSGFAYNVIPSHLRGRPAANLDDSLDTRNLDFFKGAHAAGLSTRGGRGGGMLPRGDRERSHMSERERNVADRDREFYEKERVPERRGDREPRDFRGNNERGANNDLKGSLGSSDGGRSVDRRHPSQSEEPLPRSSNSETRGKLTSHGIHGAPPQRQYRQSKQRDSIESDETSSEEDYPHPRRSHTSARAPSRGGSLLGRAGRETTGREPSKRRYISSGSESFSDSYTSSEEDHRRSRTTKSTTRAPSTRAQSTRAQSYRSSRQPSRRRPSSSDDSVSYSSDLSSDEDVPRRKTASRAPSSRANTSSRSVSTRAASTRETTRELTRDSARDPTRSQSKQSSVRRSHRRSPSSSSGSYSSDESSEERPRKKTPRRSEKSYSRDTKSVRRKDRR